MTTTRRHRQDDPLDDSRVALVLTAAAAPTEPGQQPGEAAALAAFRGAVPTPTRRIRMLPSLKAAAIAATATGALLTGGIAAASTGALPGAAQDTARNALAKVGDLQAISALRKLALSRDEAKSVREAANQAVAGIVARAKAPREAGPPAARP